MSAQQENKDGKRNGFITTLLVHLCLLLLCAFFGFSYEMPPKGDIAIGFEAVGVPEDGANNNTATAENIADRVQEQQVPDQSSAVSDEPDLISQDDSPVTVNKPDKNKKNNDASNTASKDESKKPDPKVSDALKDALSNVGGPLNPGGSGEGDGDQNAGGGGSSNQSGGSNGGGGMFDLGGRKAVKHGELQHKCGKQGRVKVRVIVDQSGKVLDAKFAGGTTDQCLRDRAIKAALGTKYEPDANGRFRQEGTIELKFTVSSK